MRSVAGRWYCAPGNVTPEKMNREAEEDAAYLAEMGKAYVEYEAKVKAGKVTKENAQKVLRAPAQSRPDFSPTFEDVTERAGLATAGAEQCAWADYDNDGHPDVLIGSKLFHNNGNGTFTDVTAAAGVTGPGVWGDFDNDGHLDLYAWGGPGTLYRNRGNGTFAAVPMPANPFHQSLAAAWGDVDNDGYLDLYVPNYEDWLGDHPRPHPDVLFHNNRDGTFKQTWQSPPGQVRCGRGVNWADFNEDGRLDIFVSNYRLMPNQLWVNDGRGNLSERAAEHRVAGHPQKEIVDATESSPAYPVHGHTIGSCWGDLDGDGHLDLVVVNLSHKWGDGQQNHSQVLINSGPPHYVFSDLNLDDKAKGGIYWQESYSKPALGDVGNNGHLDLYLTTIYPADHGDLFLNDGTGHFTPAGDAMKLRTGPSYQVAWADYDGDGALDLMVAGRLFRNKGPVGSWLKVKVIGGAGSNAAGIGTRVRLCAAGRWQVREVCGGNSGNQDPLTLHLGLGKEPGPLTVEAFFPSGKYLRLTGVKPNTTLVIREADATRGFWHPTPRFAPPCRTTP
jgi:hypothetical protein